MQKKKVTLKQIKGGIHSVLGHEEAKCCVDSRECSRMHE